MVPPAIQPMPRQGIIRTRKGKNITLRCAGKGNPNPRISWSKQVGYILYHLLPHRINLQGIICNGSSRDLIKLLCVYDVPSYFREDC